MKKAVRDGSCSCNRHTAAPRASSQGLAWPSLPLQRMNCGVLADSSAEFRSQQRGQSHERQVLHKSLNSLHRMAPTYRVVCSEILQLHLDVCWKGVACVTTLVSTTDRRKSEMVQEIVFSYLGSRSLSRPNSEHSSSVPRALFVG